MKKLLVGLLILGSISSFADINYGAIHSPLKENPDGSFYPEQLLTFTKNELKIQTVFPNGDKKVEIKKISRDEKSFVLLEDVHSTECENREFSKGLGYGLESQIEISRNEVNGVISFKTDGTILKAELEKSLEDPDMVEFKEHILDMLGQIDSNNILTQPVGTRASVDTIKEINKIPEGC